MIANLSAPSAGSSYGPPPEGSLREWTQTRLLVSHRRNNGETGQITIEVLLTIAGVVVPLALIIFAVLAALKPYYSVTNWVITLPFP
jgi:hypothetical protein